MTTSNRTGRHNSVQFSSDALYVVSLSGRPPSCTRLARSLVVHAEDGSRAIGTCVASAVGVVYD